MTSDTRIQERAYAIWEAEGRPHGKHDEHWHRAAQEIAHEESDRSPNSGPGPRPAEGGGPAESAPGPGLRSHKAGTPQASGAKPGTLDEAGKGEPARRTRRSAPASS
jgi:hypothetical protein